VVVVVVVRKPACFLTSQSTNVDNESCFTMESVSCNTDSKPTEYLNIMLV